MRVLMLVAPTGVEHHKCPVCMSLPPSIRLERGEKGDLMNMDSAFVEKQQSMIHRYFEAWFCNLREIFLHFCRYFHCWLFLIKKKTIINEMIKLIIYLTVNKLTSKNFHHRTDCLSNTEIYDIIALIIYSNVTLQVFIIP